MWEKGPRVGADGLTEVVYTVQVPGTVLAGSRTYRAP